MQINNGEKTQPDGLTTCNGSRTVQQVLSSEGKLHKTSGEVIVEISVSLTVNGEVWLSTLCTPVELEAMALGFLYNEGIIEELSSVASVRVCPQGDNIDVWLTSSVEKPQQWTRTSGCSGGVTGVGITKKEQLSFTNGGVLTPFQINHIMHEFYKVQTLYRLTGGVHTSALSDGQKIILVTEDIGRHNTLDKLSGRCLLENISPARRILLTTGRISSEMLQKAARIKAPIVISRTSPSSRSIEMAQAMGITLIGYARRDAFTIYTHPQRIIVAPEH